MTTPGIRRAAVVGSPIAHSRSPHLHLAAYAALGLDGWTYDRIECAADDLPALVGGLGPEWVGLSVTMPDKFAALGLADERTPRADLVGSANTLVRTDAGWLADNTDVDGITGALGTVLSEVAGLRAAIVGSGGTAPAAVVALAELGVADVVIVARNPVRAAELIDLASRLNVGAHWVHVGTPLNEVDVAVSTIPADAVAPYVDSLSTVPVVLDAIYDPWPTPLAMAVLAAGGQVVNGLQMLVHQAFTQVEHFTGRPAPKEAMFAALDRP